MYLLDRKILMGDPGILFYDQHASTLILDEHCRVALS
jgi:hypothetical protein